MKNLLTRPAAIIFFSAFAVLIFAYHAFFFVTPRHENGDFAVNALQIDRAKHLDEFYGNYSRFHFNHPGPAFFYIYAAGEYLLFDWLQVVPSPHNAHALAGTVLQIFFFSLALGIAASWVQRAWFLPLAIGLAGGHFALAQNTFVSIWPPHALLMPFLCFLVAGASFAAGRAQHLPLMVLTGGFLVHGHVAQPLPVALLFLAAYVMFWRGTSATPDRVRPWHLHPKTHRVAAACAGIFLLPFLVDLSFGAESNLAQILRFNAVSDAGKTMLESFLYLLSFFTYHHDQDHYLGETGLIDAGFLGTRPWAIAAWLGVITILGICLWRLRRKVGAESAVALPFLRALGWLLLIGFAAALIWGLKQTGPMFEFNGHYFFALTYAVLLMTAAALSNFIPDKGAALFSPVLYSAGAAAIMLGKLEPESSKGAEHSWLAATERVRRADPHPSPAKFLVFNPNDWGDAARTALALKRLRDSYRVDETWRFMFGRYRTLGTEQPEAIARPLSLWRLSRKAWPQHSELLEGDLRVYFEPFELDPRNGVIDCSKDGNLDQYALFGLTPPDGRFAWTNQPKAAIQFRSAPVGSDVVLSIDAEPFLVNNRVSHQPMHLWVNDRKVGSFDLGSRQVVEARIPAETWNLESTVTIVFHLPSATSPLRLGLSADPRRLGWAIYRLSLATAQP